MQSLKIELETEAQIVAPGNYKSLCGEPRDFVKWI